MIKITFLIAFLTYIFYFLQETDYIQSENPLQIENNDGTKLDVELVVGPRRFEIVAERLSDTGEKTDPYGFYLYESSHWSSGEGCRWKPATITIDPKKVKNVKFVMAGDGDMQEGVSHEACSFAGHNKLSKLIMFYDSNNITIDGKTNLSFSTSS